MSGPRCLAVWLAALCWPAVGPAQEPAPPRATVATHYFYWYRWPDEHFPAPGREGHHHHFAAPEKVSYESAAWHLGEFRDMASCGIDVALPVSWGAPGAYRRPNLRFSRLGLPAMVEALDQLQREGGHRVRLGLFYDTSTLWNAARGVEPRDERADLTTDAGLDLFCGTVLGFFEAIPPRHWGRHRGRPLVVLYTSGFARRWDGDLAERLRAQFAERFPGERPFVIADASWGEIGQDRTTSWGAALNGPVLFEGVAQIGPGYDDTPVPGRRTPIRPREDGAFYRFSWRAAIAARPELVLLETWNEMHEGTEICRTAETGARYLDLTGEGVRRLRAGDLGPEVRLRWTAPRPRPDLSWGAAASDAEAVSWAPGAAAGLRPMRWEDGPFESGADAVRVACPAGRPVTYLYFQVSDHWRFDVDAELVFEVQLADEPGEIHCHFDSRAVKATLAGAYTSAEPLEPGGEMAVASRVWRLRAARLANRQNGGADLRLAIHGGTAAVRGARLRPASLR